MNAPFAARYDLSKPIGTFDFFAWLVHVQAMGANEIVFGGEHRATKWDAASAQRRLENVLKPGCAFAGLPWRMGNDGKNVGSHMLKDLVRVDFKRLTTVKPAGEAKYTVTLRQTAHNPHRNSNVPMWREFAQDIGAVVIEDYDVKPIDLHERMALYAGAKMNFGVTNGPVAMLFVTDYPYMLLDCPNSMKGFVSHGIHEGYQVPWAGPDQILVWEMQSRKALDHAFRKWSDQC